MPANLNAEIHTLELAVSATCGFTYMLLDEVPSSAVTAVSQVIVDPEIVPRRSTTSKLLASVARNTYDVPLIDLKATEKLLVLYASVPREVHVEALADEAYSIAEPLCQNSQCSPEAESLKLLRSPAVVGLSVVDEPTPGSGVEVSVAVGDTVGVGEMVDVGVIVHVGVTVGVLVKVGVGTAVGPAAPGAKA
jgi:hypothetical protein